MPNKIVNGKLIDCRILWKGRWKPVHYPVDVMFVIVSGFAITAVDNSVSGPGTSHLDRHVVMLPIPDVPELFLEVPTDWAVERMVSQFVTSIPSTTDVSVSSSNFLWNLCTYCLLGIVVGKRG